MTSHCRSCGGDVVGLWRECPLCRLPLERDAGERDAGERDAGERGAGERDTAEPLPAAPLRFIRTQLRTVLLVSSILFVLASFGAQALIPDLMAPLRTVWLSVAVLWLVVMAAVQRRRNMGSLVGWLVVLLSLSAAAWSWLAGPELWATTWAIPAICTAANLALGIVMWIMRLNPEEYISKAVLVAAFGMVPGLFVLFGWVTTPVPSLACVGLSVVLLILMVVFRPAQLGDALHRRLQI
ncbi:MAG TPA: DUF6320 domain-containing protein [Actinomycetaceae bacterium]|nr:DUF6320 domain-containing protein [Actinomycetaceae bacterium]